MGSHGANGFKELFIGSNTEKVVRTSKAPVLVIKNDHATLDIVDFESVNVFIVGAFIFEMYGLEVGNNNRRRFSLLSISHE